VSANELRSSEAIPREAGATFALGEGGHLIVALNGRRSVPPQRGGSKELGKGLWLAILKQLDIRE
jgi:mRNA interferase HicA